MPVHQIPPRTVKWEREPSFPAAVEVCADLIPGELFGDEDLTGRLRLANLGTPIEVAADMFHGGIRVLPGVRLDAPSIETQFFDLTLRLDGSRATVSGTLSSKRSFKRCIHCVATFLPGIVGFSYREPVEIRCLWGRVGEQEFEVEVQGIFERVVRVVNPAVALRSTMTLFSALPKDSAARVLAAVRYLNQARWLTFLAEYPNQFAAERLLNLSKLIEVLFACDASVDDLREQLRQLSLKEHVVQLIAGVIYVRNQVDVGHCKLHSLQPEELGNFHVFVENATEVITWLLRHTTERLAAERYTLPAVPPSSLQDKTMQRVSELLKGVNPLDPRDYLHT